MSGYVLGPKRMRREKPRFWAFTLVYIPKILALKPDVVLAFSDPQAEITQAFLREG